jgi:hypothetical protein
MRRQARAIAHGIRAWQSLQHAAGAAAALEPALQRATPIYAARAVSTSVPSLYDGRTRAPGPDYSLAARTPANYGFRCAAAPRTGRPLLRQQQQTWSSGAGTP